MRQLAGRRNKRTDYPNPAYLFVACDFSFGLSFERDQFFSALKPLLSVKARLLNKQFASKCPPILSAFFCVECTPFIILFFEDVFSVPSFREQCIILWTLFASKASFTLKQRTDRHKESNLKTNKNAKKLILQNDSITSENLQLSF